MPELSFILFFSSHFPFLFCHVDRQVDLAPAYLLMCLASGVAFSPWASFLAWLGLFYLSLLGWASHFLPGWSCFVVVFTWLVSSPCLSCYLYLIGLFQALGLEVRDWSDGRALVPTQGVGERRNSLVGGASVLLVLVLRCVYVCSMY